MVSKRISYNKMRLQGSGFVSFFLLFFIVLSFNANASNLQNDKKVTGVVTDLNKEPLIGASVRVLGTTEGTITDFDGKFTLMVNSLNSDLEISYIGYEPKKVNLKGKQSIIIQLKEDSKQLDEVVVVGYGVQKKVNLSGSVSVVEGKQIAAKPASDVMSALQGVMPGVAISRQSGQPGSEASGLQVRGASSVNSTSTLVLIDGVEGDMTLLNPNDIESISVLKDASSCAIYGARAAAGVVLITTKSGESGKARVNYNGYFAINTPGNMPERLPAWEEQNYIDQSRIAASGNYEWSPEKASWVGNPNFNSRPLSNGRWDYFDAANWLAEGTKKYTTQQSHSVSVSGKGKGMDYMLSANYFDKSGLLKYGPDDSKRFNFHAKVNANINKYMDLGINLQYQSKVIDTSSYGAGNLFNLLYTARGRQSIYVPDGDESLSIYNGDLQVNPIDVMKNGGTSKTKYEFFTGKAQLSIKDFIKGLNINLSASRKAGFYSKSEAKRTILWTDRFGSKVRNKVNVPNSLYKDKYSDYHDLFEATANYNFDLNDKEHNFNILLGTSYDNYRKDEMDAKASSMNSNDFFSFNAFDTSVASNTVISDQISPWSMMSYFGRFNYNYKERYLFEANVRYDGSSRLSPENRWKAFPSMSLAWRINEEKWFKAKYISNLKLRGSWGQLGNGAVLGLYDYLTLINNQSYITDKAYYQSTLASKDKTWETIETTNLGIDLGLFNNRLTGTFEYYWKYNNDMLSSYQLPHQIGIKVSNGNIGKLKTWGWDFNISWRDKIKELNYQISFNISDSQNKLVKYDGAKKVSEGEVSLLEGYEINSLWGYKTDGYWKSSDEYSQYKTSNPGYKTFNDGKIAGGDVKYVSQGNADHTIGIGDGTLDDHGDLVYLGNTNPRYLYGINLSAQWKGFDISALFQGVGKRSILLNPNTIAPFYSSSFMPWTIHRDFWTEDNQDAYWPRLYNYSGNDFNFKSSDKWIQKANYIRLKNLTFGYTVPISKKIVDNLRIYVVGEDIWEHTPLLSVLDPEVASNASKSLYPFFRTWSIGMNINF